MSIELNYVGHSCFGVISGNETVLIDPFISQNPKAKVNFDLKKVKYIFVTHGHADHLGDAIAISQRTGAKIFAIFELANYCTKKGANAMGVGLGGEIKFSWGNAKFLPAFHSSSTPDGVYAGCAASVMLNFNDTKIYHAGDTSLSSEMKVIGEIEKPDVALLPIGGVFTMGIEEAATAAKWLGAYTIVPMHYDTFDMIKADTIEFNNLVEYHGKSCKIMQPGDKIEF